MGLGSGDLIEHLLGESRDPEDDEQLVAAQHALYAAYFDRLPALDAAGEPCSSVTLSGTCEPP